MPLYLIEQSISNVLLQEVLPISLTWALKSFLVCVEFYTFPQPLSRIVRSPYNCTQFPFVLVIVPLFDLSSHCKVSKFLIFCFRAFRAQIKSSFPSSSLSDFFFHREPQEFAVNNSRWGQLENILRKMVTNSNTTCLMLKTEKQTCSLF